MTSANHVAITLDIDWAPDFVIESVASELLARNVRATWFVTHHSPTIDWLASHSDMFELGIHPNFQLGSTHGDEPETVLKNCLNIVPEARSVRTHGLVQSTNLLITMLEKTALQVDVSLFLPKTIGVCPVMFRWGCREMLRVPYVWEDDYETQQRTPDWSPQTVLAGDPGVKVFNFHPIHIYLNSANLDPYHALKCRQPDLVKACPQNFEGLVRQGEGTGSMFQRLLEFLSDAPMTYSICEIADDWQVQIAKINEGRAA